MAFTEAWDATFEAAPADSEQAKLGAGRIRDLKRDIRERAPILHDGRLTLTTALPVTTADVTGVGTVYYTPLDGDCISLHDGISKWFTYYLSEMSVAVPAVASKMYDVFCYANAGVPTLEALAWTNDTTRATAIARQDGVLVKSGDSTRLYLGSFRTTTVAGQTEDSFAKRYLWNMYNRRMRSMRVVEATDSWNYTTATLRQANANAANQLDLIQGVSEDEVEARVETAATNGTASVAILSGIGLDSTSANASGAIIQNASVAVISAPSISTASWRGFTGVGRHYLAWLEYSGATGVTTWYGDSGAPTLAQSGIHGSMMG